MNSFHNTIKLSGEELTTSEVNAQSQEEIITGIFTKEYTGLTASEVLSKFPSERTPITSIRRAMTNLCTQGKLHKTSSMKTGPFGKPEHIYSTKKSCIGCKNECICNK